VINAGYGITAPELGYDDYAGKNYPVLWAYIEDANNKYIHRHLSTNYFSKKLNSIYFRISEE
jgi:hypothetical protein